MPFVTSMPCPTEEDILLALAGTTFRSWPQDEPEMIELFASLCRVLLASRNHERTLLYLPSDAPPSNAR
jgi:hypothetical protein